MPEFDGSYLTDAEADAVQASYARLKQGLDAFPEQVRDIEPALRSVPAPISQ